MRRAVQYCSNSDLMSPCCRQNGDIHITTCLVLACVENGKVVKWPPSAVPCAHPRWPQAGVTRSFWKGRISVLGGDGGAVELSRTIFGRTSWLPVGITGRGRRRV